ncbi:MAG: C25 family cysteine peptidase [Prolixibacteraceae bacterium]
MPVKYINLLIPANSETTGIVINKVKKQTNKLDHPIAPAQYPEPIGDGDIHEFVKPDANKYNSDDLYPSTCVQIAGQNSFRGNRIVTLAIYPFLYNSLKNKLEVVSSIDFTLTTSYVEEKTMTDQVEIDENSMTGKVLKSIVDNKDDVKKYGNQHKRKEPSKSETIENEKTLKSATATNSISVDADYVIVTSETLAPAFNEFIAWKKRKGIKVELVTIQDIYANYSGDLISGITDSAGDLRKFLYDAYDNGDGIDYALLAGDNSILPIRFGYHSNYLSTGDYIIPTDLYFSDFDGDWNVDADSRFGEPQDNVDFNSEIFVGRIMVQNFSEILTWTKKVKTYESNPGNGNYSYLTKAFFTQADQLMAGNQANYILTRIPWLTSNTVFEEEGSSCTSYVPNTPTGQDVINEFNKHYGLCSFMAHGSPCNVAVATLYYNSENICSGGAYTGSTANTKRKVLAFNNGATGCCVIAENGNGFDNISNNDYPTIYYSISCTTMPFDDYEYSISPTERNMGESYTCISEGGGPTYLGNTRNGWVSDSYLLFEQFINAIKDSSMFNIGIAEAKSKFWYNDRYLRFSHNLLGCPETELWTATPTTFSSASVTQNGYNVTVSTGGESNCTICLMSAYDNGASYYNVQPNVSSYTFPDVGMPYYVTITKHNKIPYIKNLTTVLFENKTFSSDAYISCQTLSAGYSVDPNHTPDGNVVIASGASVTFDATGTILLDHGFEVQLGATFEAR